MFEKLRPDPEGGSISRTAHDLFKGLGLYHEDEKAEGRQSVPPEPYTAIIDGVRWDFHDKDTYLAICAEKPEYSCIVNLVTDDTGEVISGECIYGQLEIMEDMERLGFGVVDETLSEAQRNYNLYNVPSAEQASMN